MEVSAGAQGGKDAIRFHNMVVFRFTFYIESQYDIVSTVKCKNYLILIITSGNTLSQRNSCSARPGECFSPALLPFPDDHGRLRLNDVVVCSIALTASVMLLAPFR